MMSNSIHSLIRTTCSRTRYVVNTQRGTPLYKPCTTTKGVVLGPFWSENAGINVGNFDLESGLVFEEPTGAYA